jgi:hypothetical protein
MMPVAPYESMRVTESEIAGAITPGPEGRTMDASFAPAGALASRGTLFARAWRFASGAARPRADSRTTC